MLTPTINSTAPNAAAQPRDTNMGSKDIFLKLLVAQMKFQDPLKPQDPTKMSTQLAQFNMVEQQTNTNTLLEQMVANGGSQSVTPGSNAASYLGHTATISTDAFNFTGTPTPFGIELGANASNVSVQIVDASGLPIRTMQMGALSAGITPATWDGKDDSGAVVPQGTYKTIIQASDSQGQAMQATMLQQGLVNAVKFGSSGPLFVVAGMAVPQSAIQEITL